MTAIRRFLRDDHAATAVEYAVMLAAIIVTAIVGILSVGNSTSGLYDSVTGGMASHGIN